MCRRVTTICNIRKTKTKWITKQIMKNMINKITQWRASLPQLNWGPKHAQRSARIALSRAAWLGLDQEEAIRTVVEMGLDEFFHENPQNEARVEGGRQK